MNNLELEIVDEKEDSERVTLMQSTIKYLKDLPIEYLTHTYLLVKVLSE